MKHSANFRILSLIRNSKFTCVLFVLLSMYIFLAFIFAFVYYQIGALDSCDKHGFGAYVYFSFITATTVGYGDFAPISHLGKMIVIFQSLFYTVYTAIMVSIITSKLLWTHKDTVVFSDKIIIDKQNKCLYCRIINSNSMPIINPEIRIILNTHFVGDGIAVMHELDNSLANPVYLGKHDYTICFGTDKQICTGYSEYQMIINELVKALQYQKEKKEVAWRFGIRICISGSNGIQAVAEMKKYRADSFVLGTKFRHIRYNGNDENKLGIVYDKIGGFWDQFNSVIEEKTPDIDSLKENTGS